MTGVEDLTEAIAGLRKSLLAAMEEGQGQPMQFGLSEVEVTLQLVATKHGGGKIGWSVLGVDGSYDSAKTHSVKLKLQPTYQSEDGTYTRDFTIASQASSSPEFGPAPVPGAGSVG